MGRPHPTLRVREQNNPAVTNELVKLNRALGDISHGLSTRQSRGRRQTLVVSASKSGAVLPRRRLLSNRSESATLGRHSRRECTHGAGRSSAIADYVCRLCYYCLWRGRGSEFGEKSGEMRST